MGVGANDIAIAPFKNISQNRLVERAATGEILPVHIGDPKVDSLVIRYDEMAPDEVITWLKTHYHIFLGYDISYIRTWP